MAEHAEGGAPNPGLTLEQRAKTTLCAGISLVAGLVGIESILHHESPFEAAGPFAVAALSAVFALRNSQGISGRD